MESQEGATPFVHAFRPTSLEAIVWDCRFLREQAAAEGYSLQSVSSWCLGPENYDAGDKAAYWGERLQASCPCAATRRPTCALPPCAGGAGGQVLPGAHCVHRRVNPLVRARGGHAVQPPLDIRRRTGRGGGARLLGGRPGPGRGDCGGDVKRLCDSADVMHCRSPLRVACLGPLNSPFGNERITARCPLFVSCSRSRPCAQLTSFSLQPPPAFAQAPEALHRTKKKK